MANLSDTDFVPASEQENLAGINMLSVDVHESEKEFSLQAELPSKRAEDVEVCIADDFLTIRSHYKINGQKNVQADKWELYAEGKHLRTIMLPQSANLDEAEAEMNKNMLTIKVPKKKDADDKARKLTIKKID